MDVTFLKDYFTTELLFKLIRVGALLIIGFPVVSFVSRITHRMLSKYGSVHVAMLGKKAVYYLGITVILISVLSEFGFNLSVLLGAAGVFGVAIGFASQTSFSNIISGIFLLAEAPFKIGDVIEVGSVMGTILSVDLLSTKLKTFDNRLVRIPHEHLIKSTILNVTYFDTRRFDFSLPISYRVNIPNVLGIIKQVIENNAFAKKDQAPFLRVTSINESNLTISVGVWATKKDLGDLKNSLIVQLKDRFDQEGIELPYPHLRVDMEK